LGRAALRVLLVLTASLILWFRLAEELAVTVVLVTVVPVVLVVVLASAALAARGLQTKGLAVVLAVAVVVLELVLVVVVVERRQSEVAVPRKEALAGQVSLLP